jgi:hypothetical protein
MTKFIGALADIGIAKEGTRGTAESSASFYVPKTSFSYDDKVGVVVDESSIGVIEDSTGQKVHHKSGEGEIEANIRDKSFGLILLAMMGSVSTSGPTDSAYTHVFSVLQSAQHPSLTIFQEDANQDYKYALAMLTNLDINIELEKFAMFKAGFMSKAGATATLTPSYSAENMFLPQHGTIKVADTQANLGAASAINIRSVKLTFAKNVEEDNAIGNVAPVDILNKQFSAEGEMEIVYDAETFKTYMLDDTERALRIELNNSDVLIGATSTPKLTVDFHSIKVTEFTRNFSNPDITMATIKFKAFYKLADSKLATITLINAQASY